MSRLADDRKGELVPAASLLGGGSAGGAGSQRRVPQVGREGLQRGAGVACLVQGGGGFEVRSDGHLEFLSCLRLAGRRPV